MTVICAQLALNKMTHATDSLLTTRKSRKLANGSGQPKFLQIPQFRGAISWWGQVSAGKHWNAKSWLEGRLLDLGPSPAITPDEFAVELASELTFRLRLSHIQESKGIGLHFTFFELIDDEWVPELFLITNYLGLEYRGGTRFVAQRQTFHWLSGNSDARFELHHQPEFRRQVQAYLQFKPIIFSNGQPSLFGLHMPVIMESLAQHPVSDTTFWDSFPLNLCGSMTETHIRRRGKKAATVGFPCFDLQVSPGINSAIYNENELTQDQS